MGTVLITNGQVVNENSIQELDLYLKDGRIHQIGPDLSHLVADEIIDATGKMVLPGMIDDQVHFREPGLTHKGEIATESAAAIAGGITSYMEMPNVSPLTISEDALKDKLARGAQKSRANFAFYLGASNDNLEAIKSLNPQLACGVKVFMGASTGNMLVDKPEILEGIFSSSPILIATHCEDTPMILANEQAYRDQYGEDVPMKYHPLIRSEAACWKSSSFAVELAKKHDTRLHVLHITTEKELQLFEAGDVTKKRITAEACVHHLFFSEEDYETKGSLIKCNPAVKKASDRDAILKAVQNDVIDVIATDHAPHTWEEKQASYFKAPSGLPLVQDALLSLLEHYHRGALSLERIVNKTSHAVAQLYQIKERGFLKEGFWGDIVIVDLNTPTVVDDRTIYSKCAWTPFAGYTFKSSIVTTLINGEIAYKEGVVRDVRGMQLTFDR